MSTRVSTYCIRILTINYGMNYMDQFFTKLVLHVCSTTRDIYNVHDNQQTV